jgi:hypothetical protein
MNTMMGTMEDGSHYSVPASREAILTFNRTRNNADGPSKDNFKADLLTKPIRKSRWNTRLFDVFIGDYVENGFPFTNSLKDELQTYFVTYLQTLQRKQHRSERTEPAGKRNRILRRKQNVRSKLSLYTYSDTLLLTDH